MGHAGEQKPATLDPRPTHVAREEGGGGIFSASPMWIWTNREWLNTAASPRVHKAVQRKAKPCCVLLSFQTVRRTSAAIDSPAINLFFLFQSPPYMEMSLCALKRNSLPSGPQVKSPFLPPTHTHTHTHTHMLNGPRAKNMNSAATFSNPSNLMGSLTPVTPGQPRYTRPLVQATLERVGWSLACNRISHIEPDCVIHLRARWGEVFPSSQPTGFSQSNMTYLRPRR